MLCRPVRKKKTEGLQYQHAPFEPRFSIKSRDSCFVIRKNRWSRLGVALPANPGGPTNWGFHSYRSYREWEARPIRDPGISDSQRGVSSSRPVVLCCRKGYGEVSGTSLHFSPPDGRSTRYERQDFVALAWRAQRTVQVRLRAPRGARLVLTALSPTSPRHVMRNTG